MALIDLTNQTFGRLTVLYRDIEAEKLKKDRHAIWKCKCECGNEVSVVGKDLRTGKTQSCGCLQKERTSKSNSNQLIGQRFGKLTVIKQLPSKNSRTYWECQCDCGNIKEVCARELMSGDTKSCGCLFSKGEHKIALLLDEMNITYKKEYIFSDYKSARFDFALFKNDKLYCLIEYDGPQHFANGVSGGWNSKERYDTITHPKDIEKNEYCKKHNIPLLRIPYYQYDILDKQFLEKEIKKCIVDLSLM